MDTLIYPALITTTLFGGAAALTIGLGIVWLFCKKTRLKRLAEWRRKLDELSPADPEYGQMRALYTSMVIDAQRWGFIRPESGSCGNEEYASQSGSDHAAIRAEAAMAIDSEGRHQRCADRVMARVRASMPF